MVSSIFQFYIMEKMKKAGVLRFRKLKRMKHV